MGLISSLLNVFSVKYKLSSQKIKVSAIQISQFILFKINKLRAQNTRSEKYFIQYISGSQRNLSIQRVLLNQMILESIKFGVYQQLYKCAQHIKNQAVFIAEDQKKISNQCLKNIFAIVYLYKQFQLDKVIDLKQFIPSPYPTIGLDKLEKRIRQYLDYKQPSQYQRNLFVNQLRSHRRQMISIQRINQVGHNFVKNPKQKQQKAIFSVELYARSIQDFKVDEKQHKNEDFAAQHNQANKN